MFAQGDDLIAVYLPKGGTPSLKLGSGTYKVKWFNPRTGGLLVKGSVETIQGPGEKPLGAPPSDPDKDWAILVAR